MLGRRSLWSLRLRYTPAGADYEENPVTGLVGWLPDAVALTGSARGLKELAGVVIAV